MWPYLSATATLDIREYFMTALIFPKPTSFKATLCSFVFCFTLEWFVSKLLLEFIDF